MSFNINNEIKRLQGLERAYAEELKVDNPMRPHDEAMRMQALAIAIRHPYTVPERVAAMVAMHREAGLPDAAIQAAFVAAMVGEGA